MNLMAAGCRTVAQVTSLAWRCPCAPSSPTNCGGGLEVPASRAHHGGVHHHNVQDDIAGDGVPVDLSAGPQTYTKRSDLLDASRDATNDDGALDTALAGVDGITVTAALTAAGQGAALAGSADAQLAAAAMKSSRPDPEKAAAVIKGWLTEG